MLRDAFPGPRRIVLAGVEYSAEEFRLRDLAALESLALDATGGGGDALLSVDRSDRRAYRRALRRAYDAAGAWDSAGGASGDGWGSPVCDAYLFGTLEGRTAYLAAALRPSRLFPGEARALAESLAPAEWAALDTVCLAPDRLALVQGQIDAECGIELPPPAPGEEMPWAEAVAAVCKDYGLSPEEAGALYLSQFRMLRTGGRRAELPSHSRPWSVTPEDWRARVQGPRAAFWNESNDE